MWDVNSQQCQSARQWCKEHSSPADYMRVCQLRDDITLANIALVLIHQADFLLKKLLEKHKQDFLENGGIKEQMSAARRNWREEYGMGYLNGNYGKNALLIMNYDDGVYSHILFLSLLRFAYSKYF